MKFHCMALLGLLSASTAIGANYSIDFDSAPYVVDAPLDGVAGWTQTTPNSDPLSPLAYVYAFNGGGAATIGGFYDAPAASSFALSQSFGAVPVGPKSLYFQASVLDSTNDFADRDYFGFSIEDGTGDVLLTVSLRPTSQSLTPESDAANYEVFYAFGATPVVSASNVISEGGLYDFFFQATDTGLVFGFGNISQTFTFPGTVAGYDPNDTTLKLSLTWEEGTVAGYGDNQLLVDNISIVPEPSGFALLGLGALGFLARRRR